MTLHKLPIVLTEFIAMPMLSKNSRINKTSGQKKRVNWVAMALPLAITVGCAGPNSEIIDYTLSKAEHQALVAAEQKLMAAKETVATAAPVTVAPLAPLESKQMAEPALAAALPALDDESMLEIDKPFIVKRATPRSGKRVEIGEADDQVNLEVVSTKSRSLAPDPSASASTTGEPSISAAKPMVKPAKDSTAKLDKEAMDLEQYGVPVLAESEPKLARARARTIDPTRLGFTPSIYTTAGIGVSRMNPDTSAAPGFDTNDNVDPSGQVALGVDIARFLSLEVHSADFGSTSLTPSGRVNFHVNGVSALVYAGRNLDRFRRRGLNAYARVGFNRIENSPVGSNVPFIEQSTNRASFGLGAEYTTRWGIGLRADVTAFDGDVQYGQVGLLYRLASKPRVLPKLAAATPAEAPKLPAPNLPVAKKSNHYPELASTIPALAAAKDAQPSPQSSELTLPGYTNNYQTGSHNGGGCSGLNGTLPDVTFLRGSANLTEGATRALDDIANTLSDCSDREIVVSAHTDNAGSAIDNNRLSKMRARTVAVYLSQRGIDKNRMRAVAFGESRPIASNASSEGRKRNRRVELEVR